MKKERESKLTKRERELIDKERELEDQKIVKITKDVINQFIKLSGDVSLFEGLLIKK